MRLMNGLIFAGAVTAASLILTYSRVDAQTGSTAASGPDIPSKAKRMHRLVCPGCGLSKDSLPTTLEISRGTVGHIR